MAVALRRDDVDPATEKTTAIKIPNSIRDRINDLCHNLWFVGKRCVVTNSGREVTPHQWIVIAAALEVAGRNPGQFQTALMRRTQLRGDSGHLSAVLAGGARPR